MDITKEEVLAWIVYIFLCIILISVEFGFDLNTLVQWWENNFWNTISIIISGLLSWIISKIYFDKGNRESLKISVIFPIKELLRKSYSHANYDKLEELSRSYYVKFFNTEEREILNILVDNYQTIVGCNLMRKYAEAVVRHCHSCLESKGYDTKIISQNEQGKTVFLDPVKSGRYDLIDRLERIFNSYNIETQEQENDCQKAIKKELDCYCSMFYTRTPVEYFEEQTLSEILQKYLKGAVSIELNKLEKSKENFLNLKIVKKS